MRDDGPILGDWGGRKMAADHILRITTYALALGNQTASDTNPSGTEVSVIVDGDCIRGDLDSAVLHFVPSGTIHAPTFDSPTTLRCWFDIAGLDLALAQLRNPNVALFAGTFPDGHLLAVLRTSGTRVAVR